MKSLAPDKLWTDDQLMALKPADRKHELWFGNSVLPGFRFAVARLFEM